MEILRTYDISIAQLVPNAWVSILSFAATCKLKLLECTALAVTYTHIIQWNSKSCGEKGWYQIIGRPGFLSRQANVHPWVEVSVCLREERTRGLDHFNLEQAGAKQDLEQSPYHS